MSLPEAAPATTTELCSWEAAGTTVSAILDALDGLRRSSERTATRTAVVNLVIIAADDDERERARWALHSLGGPSPGRTLLITPDPTAPPGCHAKVTLHGTEAAGHQVWSEDVQLWVGAGAATHLDSLVEPLTFADLPVVVWWVGDVPSPRDRLVTAASAVLIDTKEAPESLAAAVEVVRAKPVLDLSWLRLTPWRELLAGLFDGPDWRPFADGVVSAEVAGKAGPRQLLGGWLQSRLGLASERVHLSDARHVSIRIATEAGGRRARFAVERAGSERLLRAHAAVEGGPSASEVLGLPDVTLPWSLGEALTHLQRDPVYDDALRAAAGRAF